MAIVTADPREVVALMSNTHILKSQIDLDSIEDRIVVAHITLVAGNIPLDYFSCRKVGMLGLIIGICAVLLIAGALGYYFYQHQKQDGGGGGGGIDPSDDFFYQDCPEDQCCLEAVGLTSKRTCPASGKTVRCLRYGAECVPKDQCGTRFKCIVNDDGSSTCGTNQCASPNCACTNSIFCARDYRCYFKPNEQGVLVQYCVGDHGEADKSPLPIDDYTQLKGSSCDGTAVWDGTSEVDACVNSCTTDACVSCQITEACKECLKGCTANCDDKCRDKCPNEEDCKSCKAQHADDCTTQCLAKDYSKELACRVGAIDVLDVQGTTRAGIETIKKSCQDQSTCSFDPKNHQYNISYRCIAKK